MDTATSLTPRSIARLVRAEETREGAGFLVHRPFPTAALRNVDPFLLFDEMGPMRVGPGEAKGAPDHPHRGFETITYILDGHFEHRDSHGHEGKLDPGGVQWMTAGSGVVHAEMPSAQLLRDGGRMHGFQIWVNLPAALKLSPPRYADRAAGDIPQARSGDGLVCARVVAGEAFGVRGAIEVRTPIAFIHFSLAPGAYALHPVPRGWTAIAYAIEGTAKFGPHDASHGALAVFADDGEAVAMQNESDAPAEVLFLAGQPIGEPIAQYGPFVMNTVAELETAFEDYRSGKFAHIPPRAE